MPEGRSLALRRVSANLRGLQSALVDRCKQKIDKSGGRGQFTQAGDASSWLIRKENAGDPPQPAIGVSTPASGCSLASAEITGLVDLVALQAARGAIDEVQLVPNFSSAMRRGVHVAVQVSGEEFVGQVLIEVADPDHGIAPIA